MKTTLISMMLTLALVAGTGTRAAADILRLAPVGATVVRSGGDAVLVDVEFRVDGMRTGANRAVQRAYLEWRVEGLDAGNAPEFSVRQPAETVGEDWAEVDREAALDVLPMRAFRLERTGGYVLLDVSSLGWNQADGTIRRFSVLVAGVDPAAVSRQIGNLQLVVRYGFIPESMRNLIHN